MGLFRKEKKIPMTSQQLTDITRGMHHAASTTSAMVAQQYIVMMEQFFDRQDDGSVKAKMVRVDMDEKHYMMLPLVSLVAPKGIALEKMKVEMSVSMTDSEVKKATHDTDGSNATRSSFTVNLAPKSGRENGRRRTDIVDIEMTFTAGDPPEGIMRIIDQYTNLIDPKKLREDEEKPSDFTSFNHSS